MTERDKRVSFKANKENEQLIPSLRELARKAKRNLNNYLNLVLSKHVQEHNDTNDNEI